MDILCAVDVRQLVETFLGRAKTDIGTSSLFPCQQSGTIYREWMVRFWQNVLLKDHYCAGSQFWVAVEEIVEKEQIIAWVGLWASTVDQLFEGAKATEAKWRAAQMADAFLSKTSAARKRQVPPLL